MTAPVKPVDAWAVVDDLKGDILTRSISRNQGVSEDFVACELTNPHDPDMSIEERLAMHGYRCVRVTVAVKEGE